MVSMLKDLTPLLLGGAALFVVVNSGIIKGLGGAVEDVSEGVGAAAQGLGAGVGNIGQGLGAGVAQAGYSTQDILLFATAAAGEIGRQSAENVALRNELLRQDTQREFTQAEAVDVAAFEITKDPLTEIQAGTDIQVAGQQATRAIIKEEEKTQWLSRFTSADDKIIATAGAVGGGLLSSWGYSPIGLLKNWITGQVSVEKDVAPQVSYLSNAPQTSTTSTTPTLKSTPIPTTTPSVSYTGNIQKDIAALPEGASVLTIPYIRKSANFVEAPIIKLEPKSTISKIGGWLLRRMTFF